MKKSFIIGAAAAGIVFVAGAAAVLGSRQEKIESVKIETSQDAEPDTESPQEGPTDKQAEPVVQDGNSETSGVTAPDQEETDNGIQPEKGVSELPIIGGGKSTETSGTQSEEISKETAESTSATGETSDSGIIYASGGTVHSSSGEGASSDTDSSSDDSSSGGSSSDGSSSGSSSSGSSSQDGSSSDSSSSVGSSSDGSSVVEIGDTVTDGQTETGTPSAEGTNELPSVSENHSTVNDTNDDQDDAAEHLSVSEDQNTGNNLNDDQDDTVVLEENELPII